MVHCCFLLWVFLASLPICVSTLCVCVCVYQVSLFSLGWPRIYFVEQDASASQVLGLKVCVIVPSLTPVTRGCHEEQMDRVYSGLAACAQGSYSSLHCCLSTNVAEATFIEKLLHF